MNGQQSIRPVRTVTIDKSGVYHGLPKFPTDSAPSTAIVTGANGISGQYMLRVLLEAPERWKKIYALSRTPPTGIDCPRIQHVAVDLLGGVEKIRSELEKHDVKADYVFFFAYKEVSGEKDGELWSGQQEMANLNGQMLRDFVLALKGNPFNRIVLQTGAKHYGLHLGPRRVPCRESDPRVDGPPNFYYVQEDILAELSVEQQFTYSVVRPCHIIGAVKGNFMNLAMALGLYFVVQKELGESAVFPGTQAKYHKAECFSSARQNAYMEEWCALEPSCGNQAFNAVNGDVSSWQRIFEELASYFGVEVDAQQFEKSAPRPFRAGDAEVLRNSLAIWAREPRVMDAWSRLAQRHGLDAKVFELASWAFADGVIGIPHQCILDTNKARSHGYFGSCDTVQDFIATFKTAAELKFLPGCGQ
jgi:nucleoside-diphosphate-sugar epimerase